MATSASDDDAPDLKLVGQRRRQQARWWTWAVFSDERLKNIKGRFNSGLKAVMQLQPIRYEYKRDNALGLKSEGRTHRLWSPGTAEDHSGSRD